MNTLALNHKREFFASLLFLMVMVLLELYVVIDSKNFYWLGCEQKALWKMLQYALYFYLAANTYLMFFSYKIKGRSLLVQCPIGGAIRYPISDLLRVKKITKNIWVVYFRGSSNFYLKSINSDESILLKNMIDRLNISLSEKADKV